MRERARLLRIMAGADTEFDGEAFPAKNAACWLTWSRSRGWIRRRRCWATSNRPSAETKALIDRFNEVSDKFAEPMDADEMEKLLDEQAKLQDKIDAAGAWELEHKLELAMDALRCPPGDQRR